MNKFILILPAAILLSSCAEMNSQFDCPMKSGIRCESIDSINAKIDSGEIGAQNNHTAQTHSQVMFTYKDTLPFSKFYFKDQPLRSNETVQHVWISPFEDKEGNFHQDSDIYTVTQDGHWVNTSLREIPGEEK